MGGCGKMSTIGGTTLLLMLVVSVETVCADNTTAAADADFERTVAPILTRRCLGCHNTAEAVGELDLSCADRAMAGGANGPVIVPGDPDASYLIERIAAGEMPPENNGKKQPLPEAEVQMLRDWVRAGAPWPSARVLDRFERTTDVRAGRDWWSLQPIRRPAVPADSANFQSQNPIDSFISARLAEQGMTAAPPTDKRTLLRRVTCDLVGLQPTPEDVDAFLHDESPDAYEQFVDRLFASPHFGERWARHWMDVVRFAETNGYERDAEKPNAWKYRDWIVDAFNSDKPFDRFVMEQLAGDELPDRDESTVIATGFNRLGTWDDEPNDAQAYQYERLEDMVHATSTAFLGLTVKCARCHDHKFDPILQTDYFRMAAAYWPGPIYGGILGGPTQDQLGYDVLGWTDLTRDPGPIHLLQKGDLHRPGPEVPPGTLSCLPALHQEFAPPPADSKTTQRRLQMAQWIVDPRNPLTARVIVNRLWQHHLGEGLVRTPDNFGFNGQKPTHPELLDWLSSELVEGGWRLKRLHKRIVMSATYRQSSLHPLAAKYAEKDSANLFWWRANRRRLDAESLRDAILQTSGQLDLRQGGPSFYPPISAEALEGLSMKSGGYKQSPPEETRRRSIYMFTKRALIAPLMTAFDACDTTLPNGRRDVTTVAPQALALLNNEWVHAQSQHFARRVVAAASEPAGRVISAWRLALGRLPSDDERTMAVAFVDRQRQRSTSNDAESLAWASLCHVLLNTNEFIYLD